MPRRAAAPTGDIDPEASPSLRKRAHADLDSETDLEATPSKKPQGSPPTTTAAADSPSSYKNGINEALSSDKLVFQDIIRAGSLSQPTQDEETPKPVPRRRGRPPKAKTGSSTPTPSRTKVIKTPTKNGTPDDATPLHQAADRSARRKTVRALIEQVRNDASDDEGDDGLVGQIYDLSDGDEDGTTDASGRQSREPTTGDEVSTPSKTPKRGRKPKVKSPTPPRDLPAHEQYFLHNKPGRPKTSDNTLASLALLSHEEYFDVLRSYKDRHGDDTDYLQTLHAQSFPQWMFELSEGFSLCLYGYGSKRTLIKSFVRHLHSTKPVKKHHKVVIVNGYEETTTLREILSVVGSAIDPVHKIPLAQPVVMVQNIVRQLSSDISLTLVVNSIDAPPLRKPGAQAILAQLASHPQVNFICSTDTPDFSLLWDIGVRSTFNFAFHDCTTFLPLTVEVDVVDSVNELLGRKAHRVNGREGVAFVLRSLPENAKNLFRLLVGELLVAMFDEGSTGDDEVGVEYRMLYNKAVEEFICTSEMAFRTLLKEFHDHQIITSYKDALGTELLSVPFAKDELEAILEDLTE
ncbi:hypothetical protein S40288_00427 [Stachybotrys chartarum IBT 40288]|nr:hypothetical protein S40288_00427 [Stachybotrys chartarum IBT 40288]